MRLPKVALGLVVLIHVKAIERLLLTPLFTFFLLNIRVFTKAARWARIDPKYLRAASPKHQLDLEIAKKSTFSKLAQNEALRALVTKILF